MGPRELSALRDFFTHVEPRLPDVVAAMYSRLFEAVPEAKALFKGDLQEQQLRYMQMLQAIVKFTRSSHLWPVAAFTGTASLPVLDKLGSIHAEAGVTREHFDKMKAVLSQCFMEIEPAAFTPPIDEALGFIFNVVARSLTKPGEIGEQELARKNQLPHHDEEPPHESFASFFGEEPLDHGAPSGAMLH